MDVLLADRKVFGQTRTQPGGIQDGAGTHDVVGGQARYLSKDIGEDIHRVADQNVNGIDVYKRQMFMEMGHLFRQRPQPTQE